MLIKKSAPVTPVDIIYKESPSIGQFPMVDTVMKYSSVGIEINVLRKIWQL
jgi:hypothetical protein